MPCALNPPSKFLPELTNWPFDGYNEIDLILKEIKAVIQVPGDKWNHTMQTALDGDSFEKQYTVSWLNQVCTLSMKYLERGSEDWEQILDKASQTLSSCAGAAAQGFLQREFRFIGPRVDDVKVLLQDGSLAGHDDVGVQTWGAAVHLSDLMVSNPKAFNLNGCDSLLELGAGTGLLSLVTAKLGVTNIVASDFHEEVLKNLTCNITLNGLQDIVQVGKLDWSQPGSFQTQDESPKSFEVILGADIVYDPDHSQWLYNTVSMYLKKPSDSHQESPPTFFLLVPVRPTHINEIASTDRVFGAVGTVVTTSSENTVQRLVVVERKEIKREDMTQRKQGRVDEAGYIMWKIQWSLSSA